MKIKTLNLKGWTVFGENNKSFEFGDTLNVIYGLNEAGKSTVRRAIGELLFGFEHKNCDVYPYSSRACTNLLLTGDIQNDDKLYHIQRELDSKENSIQTFEHTMTDISNVPISILEGVNNLIYKGIYEIELSDLLPISSDKWEIINKHISIQYGMGLAYYPKELLSELDLQMHKIWREHNRGNFEIKYIDEKLQDLYKQKNIINGEKQNFQAEKDGFNALNIEYDDINKKIEHLKSQKKYYQDNWNAWHILSNIKSIKNDKKFIELSDIGITRREYIDLELEINAYTNIKNELESQIIELKNQKVSDEDLNFDLVNKKSEIYKKEIQEQKKREEDIIRWKQDISSDVDKIAKTTWFETINDWENLDVETLEKNIEYRKRISSKLNIFYLFIGIFLMAISVFYLKQLYLWVGVAISSLFVLIYFIKKVKKNKLVELHYNNIVFFEFDKINPQMDKLEFCIYCKDISQRTHQYIRQSENISIHADRIASINNLLNDVIDDREASNNQDKLRKIIAEKTSIKYKLQKMKIKYNQMHSKLLSIAPTIDDAFDIIDRYKNMQNILDELIIKKENLELSDLEIDKLYSIEDMSVEIRLIDEKIDLEIDNREKVKMQIASMYIIEKQLLLDKRYDEIVVDIENVKNERKIAVDKYNRLKMIYELIDYMDNKFYSIYEPKIFEVASDNLSKFTLGKYTKVVADKDGELTIYNSKINNYIKVDYSISKGTLEQVYLSMRLALAYIIEKEDIIMPIVLDEVFVNWDKDRFFATCDYLFNQKNNRQMFYFTCHESVAQILENKYGANRINL